MNGRAWGGDPLSASRHGCALGEVGGLDEACMVGGLKGSAGANRGLQVGGPKNPAGTNTGLQLDGPKNPAGTNTGLQVGELVVDAGSQQAQN